MIQIEDLLDSERRRTVGLGSADAPEGSVAVEWRPADERVSSCPVDGGTSGGRYELLG